ncbi:MAG: hypothetical protein PHD01_17025, partial [Geobacteraceae bacterium]|nr:hypothetical protein [Geobacteraceae bacterium]
MPVQLAKRIVAIPAGSTFAKGGGDTSWQERFASFTMDESYLLAAAGYVEMNPVAAGIVSHPGEYPWSSAGAHLSGQDDILTRVESLLALVENWSDFLT